MNFSDALQLLRQKGLSSWSVNELKDLASNVDAAVRGNPDALFIYNGKFDGSAAFEIVRDTVGESGGTFGFINQTDASDLINHPEFTKALRNAANNDDDLVRAILDGDGSTPGLWDDVSKRMVQQFDGPIIPLVGQSGDPKFLVKPNSVLVRTEITAYLNNPNAGKLIGYDADVWRELRRLIYRKRPRRR